MDLCHSADMKMCLWCCFGVDTGISLWQPTLLTQQLGTVLFLFCYHVVTAADSDMRKVGNSFLQLKLVLNKGGKTEDVFMGMFSGVEGMSSGVWGGAGGRALLMTKQN